MPTFLVEYSIPHYGEIEIEADTLEEAREIANEDSTKGEADWDLLEDVSDAQIVSIETLDN